MRRAIREIQPTWVVGENVSGLLSWNGGLVFNEVQTDLEAEGYEVQPVLLPACAINAPHRRDRIWFVAYSNSFGNNRMFRAEKCYNERKQSEDNEQQWNGRTGKTERYGKSRITTNTANIGLQQPGNTRERRTGFKDNDSQNDTTNAGLQRPERKSKSEGNIWEQFPTQSPIRLRDDGIPNKLLIFVVKELYNKISNTSQENRIENLPEVWKRISQEEVWKKIRGLYSLESKVVLLKTMQLYSGGYYRQDELSPFGEEVSKPILQHLSRYGEFRRSPQGQELEKQRTQQFGNSLSFLPHEVALAARRFETSIAKFEAWHRNESIKAYGNSVVPQLVLQIFKCINLLESKKYETPQM